MKAWVVTGVGGPGDVLEQTERAVPEPGPAQALVEVAAVGLGLPDVLMCRGGYAFSPTIPFTPGQEVAGTVVAVGEASTATVGQRVMGVTSFYSGDGGYAEYCIVPDRSRYPIPDEMDDTTAAGFGIAFHTAWVGLKFRAEIRAGEVLLVHGGAGGTGAAAIQLGKALGAEVIATASTADKLDYCRAQGADHVINYEEDDFVAAVRSITDDRRADVVYDPVGGEACERSVRCLASGGRILAVGFASGRWGSPDTAALVMGNGAVLGVFVGAHDHDQMLGAHAELMDLFRSGALQPASTVVGFDAVADQLVLLEDRRVLGRVVAAL